MEKIGRNDPCPCGSGKKFKKCHMGREDDLFSGELGELTVEAMGEKIMNLPMVNYGRSREMVDALDIKALTGSPVGIKFVDLDAYADLELFGTARAKNLKNRDGGLFINLYKTMHSDPHHIYLAVSRNIDDSTLTHELAHALDYLGGSNQAPGTMEPLGLELGIPVDHLEHPEEYGYWLEFLKNRFHVQLDADDFIISYLYQNGMLISAKEIQGRNPFILRRKSDRILTFLGEHSEEIDGLIRSLPGYIGPRKVKD